MTDVLVFVVTRDRSIVVPAAWLPDDAGDGEPIEVVHGIEIDPRSLDALRAAEAGETFQLSASTPWALPRRVAAALSVEG